MCSHYQAINERERYFRHFGVEPPLDMGKHDVWPGYVSSFIRCLPHAGVSHDAGPVFESLVGLFGLVPRWATNTQSARHTYNARAETVAEKPSFRDAWKLGQHCIIPAEAIFEPDWRSGKAVTTRIFSADGQPFGIAGLWSEWKSPNGKIIYSYTILTLNADDHPLMHLLHKPTDEKRMVVILQPAHYRDWLKATPENSRAFMQAIPAQFLQAIPATP